ncbi:MAG: hypothetical protein KBA33_02430 [Cloacibacterium sp.]|nr:hypothetical protein [Cloacibacterium sp.]
MKKICSFFSYVFPCNSVEFALFALFLIVYGILGTSIALNYTIIYDDRIPWDAYFSFDNRAIVTTGGGFERHPLANYFFDGIRELALLVSEGKRNDVFRLVLAWLSNITISLSLVQVYKYAKNIIQLPTFIGVFLVFFFAFFSTNILLSFTPETYTYTLFCLLVFNYYAARKLQQEKNISALALTVGGVAIGGLTITNIVKIYIPLFFEKNVFKKGKVFGVMVLRGGISVAVFVLLYLNRVNFDVYRIFAKTGEQYEKFSKPKAVPIWDMIVSWFFGGNVLFSNLVVRDYHNKKGFEYKALFMDVYTSCFPYIFVGMLLGLVIWSYIKNFKNPWVQILMISFLVDIVIHCILKFGLHTSYIYGGHFVFIYPLMLGWLFFAYREKPKMLSFIASILGIMLFYLVMNNVYRTEEFFFFLEEYYR